MSAPPATVAIASDCFTVANNDYNLLLLRHLQPQKRLITDEKAKRRQPYLSLTDLSVTFSAH